MESIITQLVEGQRHLQLIFEQRTKMAQKERNALHSALKDQASCLTSNQQVHDTAILQLTDAISNGRVHPNLPGSVLQKFQDGFDPDFFFVNFERVATTATWPPEKWDQYIAPLLSVERQADYQAANPAGTTAYPDIKRAILESLVCDQEYYRSRFRKEKWSAADNPRALYYRIRDLGNRWLQPASSSIDELSEKVYLEQYLEALPSNTTSWIKQHPNLSATIAVDLNCAYHRSPEFKGQPPRLPISLPRSGSRVPTLLTENKGPPVLKHPPRPTLGPCALQGP